MENAKFIKNDNTFVCSNCGYEVPKLNYTSRDHCPNCLYSIHIDINPGDRMCSCRGLLEPIDIEINPKKGYVIIYKCKKCNQIKKNKAAQDDSYDEILKIMEQKAK